VHYNSTEELEQLLESLAAILHRPSM
jgi:selenocysteine lyase/cysteine desulfurase